MARDKQKQDDKPAGCPAWLATYGDMVTLVLVFFVLLYSFSEIDVAKWQSLVTSFTGREPSYVNEKPGQNIPNPPAVVQNPSTDPGIDPSDQSWSDLFASITKFFQMMADAKTAQTGQQHELEDMALLNADPDRINILLPERMLFNPGEYNLRADAVEDLVALVDYLEETMGDKMQLIGSIVVEGHTDNVPVVPDTRIRDNFDLAYWRAKSVYDALMSSALELPANKYLLKAEGEWYPLYDKAFVGDDRNGPAYENWVKAQNMTAAQRQRNRRVVIVLQRLQEDAVSR